MAFASPNHSNIRQPFRLTLPQSTHAQLTVYFLSDLVFASRKYPIPYKLLQSEGETILELNFSRMKQQAELNDGILNNFGALMIEELRIKIAMIFTAEKDNIFLTFIQNKKPVFEA